MLLFLFIYLLSFFVCSFESFFIIYKLWLSLMLSNAQKDMNCVFSILLKNEIIDVFIWKYHQLTIFFFCWLPNFLIQIFDLFANILFVLRTIWIRNVYRKSMKYKEQKLWFNYFPFPLPPLYKTNIYSEWKNVFNILKIHILKTKLKLKRKEFSNLIKNKRQKNV